jgi:hypothetical protein
LLIIHINEAVFIRGRYSSSWGASFLLKKNDDIQDGSRHVTAINFGLIEQTPFFFIDSIDNNVALFGKYSEDEGENLSVPFFNVLSVPLPLAIKTSG